MEAGITVATDKEGRYYCVVVVKGTFLVAEDGKVDLAGKQEPLVYADQHYGDPVDSSIKYECDFVRFKPQADVLVNGSAYSPTGVPVEKIQVSLQVDAMAKSFEVVGDRIWDKILLSITPTRPEPFLKMPITYDRAYGGVDISENDPEKQKTYLENPVGVGFYPLCLRKNLVGKPLPNIQEIGKPVFSTRGKYQPMAFGTIGRNWLSRYPLAGTYDQDWIDNVFPFLPKDFDERYFQSAPTDQQISFLKGGEKVKCVNMTPEGSFEFSVPKLKVPIVFKFRDREVQGEPEIDTLMLEPDERRFMLTWRASVAVGPKLHSLREVLVGPQRPSLSRHRFPGKRYFKSLAELVAWKKNGKPEFDISKQS